MSLIPSSAGDMLKRPRTPKRGARKKIDGPAIPPLSDDVQKLIISLTLATETRQTLEKAIQRQLLVKEEQIRSLKKRLRKSLKHSKKSGSRTPDPTGSASKPLSSVFPHFHKVQQKKAVSRSPPHLAMVAASIPFGPKRLHTHPRSGSMHQSVSPLARGSASGGRLRARSSSVSRTASAARDVVQKKSVAEVLAKSRRRRHTHHKATQSLTHGILVDPRLLVAALSSKSDSDEGESSLPRLGSVPIRQPPKRGSVPTIAGRRGSGKSLPKSTPVPRPVDCDALRISMELGLSAVEPIEEYPAVDDDGDVLEPFPMLDDETAQMTLTSSASVPAKMSAMSPKSPTEVLSPLLPGIAAEVTEEALVIEGLTEVSTKNSSELVQSPHSRAKSVQSIDYSERRTKRMSALANLAMARRVMDDCETDIVATTVTAVGECFVSGSADGGSGPFADMSPLSGGVSEDAIHRLSRPLSQDGAMAAAIEAIGKNTDSDDSVFRAAQRKSRSAARRRSLRRTRRSLSSSSAMLLESMQKTELAGYHIGGGIRGRKSSSTLEATSSLPSIKQVCVEDTYIGEIGSDERKALEMSETLTKTLSILSDSDRAAVKDEIGKLHSWETQQLAESSRDLERRKAEVATKEKVLESERELQREERMKLRREQLEVNERSDEVVVIKAELQQMHRTLMAERRTLESDQQSFVELKTRESEGEGVGCELTAEHPLAKLLAMEKEQREEIAAMLAERDEIQLQLEEAKAHACDSDCEAESVSDKLVEEDGAGSDASTDDAFNGASESGHKSANLRLFLRLNDLMLDIAIRQLKGLEQREDALMDVMQQLRSRKRDVRKQVLDTLAEKRKVLTEAGEKFEDGRMQHFEECFKSEDELDATLRADVSKDDFIIGLLSSRVTVEEYDAVRRQTGYSTPLPFAAIEDDVSGH